MKKALLLVSAVVVLSVCEQPAFAYDWGTHSEIEKRSGRKAAEAYMKRWDALNKKMDVFVNDVQKLADKIAAFNKPVFEARLTNREREYYPMGEEAALRSPVLWSRVYAKDKTLVFGRAGTDKKFTSIFFATTDPDFVFLGGIRVGASTKTLETFFGDSIDNMKLVLQSGKTIVYGPQYDGIDGCFKNFIIVYNKGVITEIIANFIDDESIMVCSEKADNFARSKLKQMGFSYTQSILDLFMGF